MFCSLTETQKKSGYIIPIDAGIGVALFVMVISIIVATVLAITMYR